MRPLILALPALVPMAMVPELAPDPDAARASMPPQCHIQRSAYCLWVGEVETRSRPSGDDGATEIDIAAGTGSRAHRIIEPWRCGQGAADLIPGYPAPADVRRTADGWLHFSLRLRRDGSCDLRISQQVPRDEIGTDYDRVMWIPIVICLGEARASYPGGIEFADREFIRQGSACSLKY